MHLARFLRQSNVRQVADRRPEWPAEQLRLAVEHWQPDVEVRLERIR
jgi:hypothetical protein